LRSTTELSAKLVQYALNLRVDAGMRFDRHPIVSLHLLRLLRLLRLL
jgi:hypothetical protein